MTVKFYNHVMHCYNDVLTRKYKYAYDGICVYQYPIGYRSVNIAPDNSVKVYKRDYKSGREYIREVKRFFNGQ